MFGQKKRGRSTLFSNISGYVGTTCDKNTLSCHNQEDDYNVVLNELDL